MAGQRIVISDYGGHSFTSELAESLSSEGLDVTYTYCAATVSPKGNLSGRLNVVAIGEGWQFEKYNPLRRLVSELRYGLGLGWTTRRHRPSEHVVCNMPVVSGIVAWLLCIGTGTKLVIWFQDVQSGIASQSLGDGALARMFSFLESFFLRRADRVIAISPELADEARRRGVKDDQIGLLENWAPVAQYPHYEEAQDHSLTGELTRPIFLYSGTLARKHDPSRLVDLAVAAMAWGGSVLVVSEGEGSDWLSEQKKVKGDQLDNLLLMPYQPFEELPALLGTADVLVVLLEPSAGAFSVPSKTLSYLCAGRPILASMPADNAASSLASIRAEAGLVSEPSDREHFISDAERLAHDPELRRRLGRSGRSFAEANFTESAIVEGFLSQLDATRDG